MTYLFVYIPIPEPLILISKAESKVIYDIFICKNTYPLNPWFYSLWPRERESEESNMWHIYLFAMYSDDLWQNLVTIELIKCWFIGETEIIHFWDFEI